MIFILYISFAILAFTVHPLFFIPIVLILLYVSPKPTEEPSEPSHQLSDEDLAHNELYLFLYTKRRYLQSQQWAYKRSQVLARDNYECQLCGSTSDLEAHHMKDYALIPNEPISSIVTLCRHCHQHQHDTHGQLVTLHDYLTWNYPI